MKTLITVISIGLLTGLFADVNIQKCVSCHGANFEKKALGKSKVVADMTKEDIVVALKGYKDGSYGGPMKALMKGQVASYSDSDFEQIALKIKGE